MKCAGCSEVLMATAVYELAGKTPGKESMAMEAFGRALLQLPITIADNAGYDSAQLISELRAAHSQGQHTMGLSTRLFYFFSSNSIVDRITFLNDFLDMEEGKMDCMRQTGVTESYVVKRQVLLSASEAAEMILRVDDIIKAAPRRREVDRSHC